MHTVETLTKMCEDACAELGYTLDVPVKINGRLSTTLGMVRYQWDDYFEQTVKPSSIEFSKNFIETSTDKSIKDVVLHEVAHYLVAIQTGHRHGHDKVFKAMCARLGTKSDGATTKVERLVPERKLYKYTIICEGCGYHNFHSRRCNVVNHPDWYMCPVCGGSLVVTQNY